MLLTVNTLYAYYPAAFWICLGLTLLLAGAGVGGAVALRRAGRLTTYGAAVASLLWCYGATVFYFTVAGRYPREEYRAILVLFAVWQRAFEGRAGEFRDLAINLVMLAPVAFLFCELRKDRIRRVIPALAVSLGFSVLIECLQYVSRTGTFETDDIFNNFIGAVLGVLVWKAWDAVRKVYLKKKKSQ